MAPEALTAVGFPLFTGPKLHNMHAIAKILMVRVE